MKNMKHDETPQRRPNFSFHIVFKSTNMVLIVPTDICLNIEIKICDFWDQFCYV